MTAVKRALYTNIFITLITFLIFTNFRNLLLMNVESAIGT